MRSLSQKRHGRFFAGWAIILTAVFSTFGLMPNGPRAVFAAPSAVTVVGNLQDELGCPGDWQPECVNTGLAYDAADDVWQGIFSVPAADFEYKTALNGSWDVNYGANAVLNGGNIALPLSAAGANTDVKFYYDDKSHWITDNFNTTIVVAPGNFQDELGCPGDWQPDCLRSWLQDIDGDGIFTFTTDQLPVGSYEGKIALGESWDVNYGDGGVPGGANIPFTVTFPTDVVVFSYDSATHIPTIEVQSRSVALVGSLQDELGCPGDWQPECAATEMAYDAEDDVWQATFNLTGNFDYKVAVNDSWDENYGAGAQFNGGNIALAANGDVKFYYDDKSHWITDNVNSVIATAAGSFQDEPGCPGDWSPDCLRSWLQDIDGDGIYTFATASLPPGNYEAKAALNESWDFSYGIGGGNDNVPFTIAEAGDMVTISYNTANNHVEAAVTPVTVEVPPEIAALVTAPARNPIQNDVFYFVMPDRFANGDPSNDTGGIAGDRLDHGFDPTDKGFFHGGDLTGMTAKLDYLADMGVTSIWMTPVFKNQPVQGSGADISAGYHGYWYVDMTQFDPHFGTNAELETLIAEAHSRGIKIFFDIITNHTADVITYEEGTFGYRNKTDYPYVDANGNEFDDRDYALSGNFPALDQATSFPYTPTFNDPAHATLKVPAWLNDPIYYHNRGNSSFSGENSLYGDFFGLDDLFTEHPDVVNGMIDIYKYWISNYDIDGFRVDTVKHVNLEFWQQFMPAILDHAAAEGKDDFFVFGEV
ncbi:MAG: hypothetical protein KDE51_10580, partial [Anaerolineales bacterium]|nr:hypothetical protein [Anaerolineales bacterium]